ncbi:hypothetical protein VPH35_081874 [Triticum aestivum]
MLILFFLLITRWSKSQNILFFQFMKVQDPDNSSQTAYDSWVKSNASPNIQRLGNGGSDYAAFVQHVGIPSTNLIFGEGPGYPVYHSLYDDFVRVEKFADPGFCRHVAASTTTARRSWCFSPSTTLHATMPPPPHYTESLSEEKFHLMNEHEEVLM